MNQPNGKVLVGMSGGVDSSVSAALLLEQGYEVMGAFMKNWSGDVYGPACANAEKIGEAFEECGWRAERRDAMRVAAQLGIPFFTFDFEEAYRRDVVEYMFREYAAGRTPNPDVMCNKYMKFDLFVKEADRLGCAFVATGHYARTEKNESGRIKILSGMDPNKDQTYFLWAIPPSVLSRVLFPIGHLRKPEVRKKARERGLIVAEKKDSMGICFVGEVEMRSFLKARIPEKRGNIVTTSGEVVGTHDGLAFYTIGQREGLGIGGRALPSYVIEKRLETNELVVSSNFDQSLFRQELIAEQTNWFCVPEVGIPYTARIRYRQLLAGCVITSINQDTIHLRFNEPQRAVTSGQSVVLYDGEEMLGGGIIV